MLRWCYQAYVNRVGVHLIGLMSGRLAIGAEQYRRLTRRTPRPALAKTEDEPLNAAVVGGRGSGKSRLIESMKEAFAGDPSLIKARFEGRGLDPQLADRLKNVRWSEVPGYPLTVDKESRRD